MNELYAHVSRIMEEVVPFNRFLGIRVDRLDRGFARLAVPFREEFLGDPRRPALHGGIISTLVDTCSGAAVWTHFDREDRISTVDIRVDYMSPGPPADIVAESTVKRIGNRVAVIHTLVYAVSDPETVIAEGRAVYSVRRSGVPGGS